jgi:hypothetical protein
VRSDPVYIRMMIENEANAGPSASYIPHPDTPVPGPAEEQVLKLMVPGQGPNLVGVALQDYLHP